MTIKIALIGAPSAGKSTLAASLFSVLKEKKIKVELIQEYAREHINKYGTVENVLSQYLFYEKQREKEDIIPSAIDVLITDSPTILSYMYALFYGKASHKDEQLLLTNMYEKFLQDSFKRYDLIYYLPSVRDYIKDGTRIQTEEEAKKIGELIYNFLTIHKIPMIEIESPNTQVRTEIIEKDINLLLQDSINFINSKLYYSSGGTATL